jgi:hypothetical protein
MRGTLPILTCDSEDGCDMYVTNQYELGVKEWRDIMRGWAYDPYKDRDASLCPVHKDEADR